MSGSASATCSAASYVQPPAKTERRAKSACSSSLREVVRPLDRRSQRLLAGIGVALALEQVETLREALEQLPGAEEGRAGGCELERKRQLIETEAELFDRLV